MSPGERVYDGSASAAFLKTSDRFGAFSNMASRMPLHVAGTHVTSSEALYQALRFPDLPDFQAGILAQKSPVSAKQHARTKVGETRGDWGRTRIAAMRYVLRVKFGAHQERMSDLFVQTAGMPIVEISRRDTFWGARPEGDRFRGGNVLGRLLMELREEVAGHEVCAPFRVEPRFPNARLLGADLEAEMISPLIPDEPTFDV